MKLSLYEDGDLLRCNKMDDEDIVKLAKTGDSYALECIIRKYKSFVISKARTYFLIGADRDDIVQEGMIGLYKAVRDYDRKKATSFRYFAEICITRQIITAIKTATRQKHIPLNSYVSLNKPMYIEESERTLLDILEESETLDPVEEYIIQEKVKRIEARIYGVLSELETNVLKSYIEGKSYEEIANELDKDKKSVDNALQRIKKKLESDFEYLFSKSY